MKTSLRRCRAATESCSVFSSGLQCVAVCCKCVAMCCGVLPCVAVCCSERTTGNVARKPALAAVELKLIVAGVLQVCCRCVAGVLQVFCRCVAVCCSVLQCDAVRGRKQASFLQCIAGVFHIFSSFV